MMRAQLAPLLIALLLCFTAIGCGTRRVAPVAQPEPCPTAPPEWRGPISSDGCPVSGMYDPETTCAIVYVRLPDGSLAADVQHC